MADGGCDTEQLDDILKVSLKVCSTAKDRIKMSNTSDTPVFSSGDYLKIKANKTHLGEAWMKIHFLANSILGSIFQKLSPSISPLTSSGLGSVQREDLLS